VRQLAPAWQVEPGDGDPCETLPAHGVACYRAHGGLALLRLLARPSVLALRDAHDRPVYVVLAGLGRDDATLVAGKAPLQVPLALLTTAWRGDFTTLWREPAGYEKPLNEGASGPVVDAVAAQLAAQQGVAAPPPAKPFDATLKARVASFQLAQGLTADGIAGPTTLMQINRASGVAEPWLAGIAPSASSPATTAPTPVATSNASQRTATAPAAVQPK
jgi:general secretion pathway protein A